MCVRTGMSLVCRLFSTGSESGAPSAGAVVSFFVSRLRLLVCERKRAVRGPGEGAESQRNKGSAARERLSGLHERGFYDAVPWSVAVGCGVGMETCEEFELQ